MRQRRTSQRREPTIALINIVFLMLIFFMVAGTLARPLDSGLELVDTSELEGRAPPDALVVHGDGRLSYHGEEVASAEAYLAGAPDRASGDVRILPDRGLDARRLVELGRELRAAGAQSVLIVTERVLE